MPSYSLDCIAKHIEAELVGDSQYKISGLNTIQAADSTELTFLANPLYGQFLSCTKAGAVIISRSGLSDYSGNALVVDSPYLAYALVSALFNKTPVMVAGIHQTAVIAASAKFPRLPR